MSKPVIWNGIEYPSMSECARVLGISRQAMHKRIEAGYTCDEDVTKGNKS